MFSGALIAAVSAYAWLSVDLVSGHVYEHDAIPYWNALVRFGFFILTAFLVATRRRTEIELAAARDRAQQANRAKSAFLAGVSHELRTPLNAIIGYSELLAEEAQAAGNTARERDLERIRRAGHHLLSLINNILDMAKIEAGKLEVSRERFAIWEAIEDVTGIAELLVRKRGNKLTVDCPEDIGEIVSDEIRLRQVLLNLLGNAAKFTEKGSITLTVGRIADDPGRISFVVADDGVGMDEGQLAKLFKPFTQFHQQNRSTMVGSGLGLAISRRLCDLLGGTINVESTPGKGTRVSVVLPAE